MVRLRIPDSCIEEHRKLCSIPLMGALEVLASCRKRLKIFDWAVSDNARSKDARSYFGELLRVCKENNFDIPTASPLQIDLLVKADDEFCKMHPNWCRVAQRTGKFLSLKTCCPTQRSVFELLQKMFDYRKFCAGDGWMLSRHDPNIDQGQHTWTAAEFQKRVVEANHLRFCPYCNAETAFYLSGMPTNTGLSRSALDHFYPKSVCPYLGVSLYNLVPSCAHCNSSLKTAKIPFDGVDRSWSHPYADNFNDAMRFRFRNVGIRHLYGMPSADLSVEYLHDRRGALARGTMDGLSLKSVYEQAYAREIKDVPMRYQMALTSAPTLLDDMLTSSIDKGKIKVFFNSSLEADRINEERLSKLTIDLTNQLMGF